MNLPNGSSELVRWYQFRIPLNSYTNAIGGISDFRSVRFTRLYLKDFTETTIFRFGTFDLYSLGADGEEGGEGSDKDIGNWE